MRTKRRNDVLLVAYLLLLLLLNLSPWIPRSPVDNGDKIAHFLMFLLLGLIGSARWVYLLPLPFVEFLQILVPERTFSLLDFAANLIGFTSGVLLGWWHEGSHRKTPLLNRGGD
ncbi:VanZ family protein [Thermococcus sp. Bubb.Bath]|uniref:VanZ family protein n=1 Tax=Thermococcus sp. Bubb.Bath TaxID=1638242 RepID=UPI00143CABC0|nr:VanZ family protein [Thermococcus sp. Bubb.Bath]NJF25236.1 VanZ family protein [Thermococcus sp. Bubb.Bath]